MPLPTTSSLSAFTGTEDPLSEGGNWNGPFQSGVRQLAKNGEALFSATGSSGTANSWWTTSFGADQEAWFRAGTTPGAGGGLVVACRIHNPGNASTMECYVAGYTEGTGFRIFKCLTGSSFTQIGSTVAGSLVDTEYVWLKVEGTSLSLYHIDSTFTTGTLKVSGTDSSVTGAGFIGAQMDGSSMLGDDFGGGALVAAAETQSFYTARRRMVRR